MVISSKLSVFFFKCSYCLQVNVSWLHQLSFFIQQSETHEPSCTSASEKQHSLRFMFVWLKQLTDDQRRSRLITAEWCVAAHLLAANSSFRWETERHRLKDSCLCWFQRELHFCINVVLVYLQNEQLNESDTELIDADVSTCERTTGTERQPVSCVFFSSSVQGCHRLDHSLSWQIIPEADRPPLDLLPAFVPSAVLPAEHQDLWLSVPCLKVEKLHVVWKLLVVHQ